MKLEKNNPRHSSVIDSSLTGLKEYWVLLLCACTGIHAHVQERTWRPSINLEVAPLGCSPPCFLEARSLTGLELTEIDRK